MDGLEITEALDLGGDRLLVRGKHPAVTERKVEDAPAQSETSDGEDASGAAVQTVTTTQVRTITEAPVVLEARGWLSALKQHYPPEAYDEAGHVKDGSTARPMTPDEAKAYMLGLLRAQNADVLPAESGQALDLGELIGTATAPPDQRPQDSQQGAVGVEGGTTEGLGQPGATVAGDVTTLQAGEA